MDLVFYLNQFTKGAKQFHPIYVLYHLIMSTLQDQVYRKTKQNLPKCSNIQPHQVYLHGSSCFQF